MIELILFCLRSPVDITLLSSNSIPEERPELVKVQTQGGIVAGEATGMELQEPTHSVDDPLPNVTPVSKLCRMDIGPLGTEAYEVT